MHLSFDQVTNRCRTGRFNLLFANFFHRYFLVVYVLRLNRQVNYAILAVNMDDLSFDLVTFIETVRAVIGEYKADPTRLDRMRKAASAQILEKYNAAQAETNLLTAWAGIHQQLTGCTTGSA